MDRLTTLPPELLLTIISHLPSSSSVLPLIQTCTYLRGFIHIHSASICNNLILTSPLYTHAASILSSSFSSTGWLLPTHRCIHAAETRIIRDKILFSGCSCISCRQLLHSSVSTSELSLTGEGLGGMLCFPTGVKKVCRAGLDNIDGMGGVERGMLKLSEPGPQFLVFLEKYSWEVVTRWGMSSGVTTPVGDEDGEPLPTIHEVEEDDQESIEAEERRREEQQRKDEEAFSFMVGNYCVRRFLEDVEKNFSRINNHPNDESLDSTPAKQSLSRSVAENLKSGVGMLKSCLGKRKEKSKSKPSTRRMMFGEIPSDEHVPTISEKERPVETWMKGLVWYYGVSTTKPLPKMIDAGQEKVKFGGCVGNVRSGLSKAGMKVRRVWRKFGRGKTEVEVEGMGEFQSLDD